MQKTGYKVGIFTLDDHGKFAAMGASVHTSKWAWLGPVNARFMSELHTGRMVDAGSHAATTREEWWYPNYVEEI